MEVAEDLKFASSLVLESEQFEGLRPNHTHGHSEEHDPVDVAKKGGVVEEGLVERQHCRTHED